jgi:hypothetical protein
MAILIHLYNYLVMLKRISIYHNKSFFLVIVCIVPRLYCDLSREIQHLGFATFQLCNRTIGDTGTLWYQNNEIILIGAFNRSD